jgi:predicted nucleotidyltransferase
MTSAPQSLPESRVAADRVLMDFVTRMRAALGQRLRQMVLFGSRARGDARDGSDYDILVVIDKWERDTRDRVLDIEVAMLDAHGALFASVVRSEQQWDEAQGFPLAMNIAREGLPL